MSVCIKNSFGTKILLIVLEVDASVNSRFDFTSQARCYKEVSIRAQELIINNVRNLLFGVALLKKRFACSMDHHDSSSTNAHPSNAMATNSKNINNNHTQPSSSSSSFTDTTSYIRYVRNSAETQRRSSMTECQKFEKDFSEFSNLPNTRKWKEILNVQLILVKYGVLLDYVLVGSHSLLNHGIVNTLLLLLTMFTGYSFSVDIFKGVVNRFSYLNALSLSVKRFLVRLLCSSDELTTSNLQHVKVVLCLTLFTVRFYFFKTPMTLLLPLKLMIIGSTSRMNDSLWRIIVPSYFVTHYLACILYRILVSMWSLLFSSRIWSIVEGSTYMYNECMPLITECFPCILSIMIFSLYIVSFTECLNRKVEQLSTTSEQLSNALHTREKFISNISHEFRTVCLSSLGSIELIKDTHLDNEQKELIENVECSNGMILSVIEDILHFARTENMTQQPSNRRQSQSDTTFDLASCLRSIHSIIKGYCKPLKVQAELEMSEDIENLWVHGAPSSLQQCLINLLSNAAKASKKGQTITLKCGISTKPSRNVNNNGFVGESTQKGQPPLSRQWFEFKVIDHGKGIEPQYLNMLFQPFVQLNSFSNCGIPGTGLGLSNVRSNISLMGGKISVQSQVGKGSTFTLLVPFQVVVNAHREGSHGKTHPLSRFSLNSDQHNELNNDDVREKEEEVRAIAENESSPAAITTSVDGVQRCGSSGCRGSRRLSSSISPQSVDSNLSRQMEIQTTYVEKYMSAVKENNRRNSSTGYHPQILLAEDNAINRMVLIRLLKNVGYEAEAVCDGQQLIDKFNPKYHRLIITDLNMPNMNGLLAAKEIRRLYGSNKHETSSPTIVLLTGDGFSDYSEDIESGIIDKVLLKPCNKEDLKNVVTACL